MLSSHTSKWKCIWHVAHCFTFLTAIPVGFYNRSIILVRLRHGQQVGKILTSDTLSPCHIQSLHPPHSATPQTATIDSGLAFVPSLSDVPGQLQANKPSGTFLGVLGPKYVTFLILSGSQRVLILNYSNGPENKRGVDGAWWKRGVRDWKGAERIKYF